MNDIGIGKYDIDNLRGKNSWDNLKLHTLKLPKLKRKLCSNFYFIKCRKRDRKDRNGRRVKIAIIL